MAWIRLEDTFPEHTKIDAAGGDAAWLHVCAIGYCNRNRTDGFIPTERVKRLSDRVSPGKLAEKLVEVGLWDRAEGGYLVHDYLEYNPTRAELEEADTKRHEDKAAAGRLGGIASGISRRKQTRSRPEAEHQAEGQAESKQNEAPPHPTPPPSVSTTDVTPSTSVTRKTPDTSGFDEFWNIWPKKEARADAVKAYAKALKGGAEHQVIVDGLRRLLPGLLATERKYVPAASKWLNGSRWEDEPAPLRVVRTNGTVAGARAATDAYLDDLLRQPQQPLALTETTAS